MFSTPSLVAFVDEDKSYGWSNEVNLAAPSFLIALGRGLCQFSMGEFVFRPDPSMTLFGFELYKEANNYEYS